METKLRHNTRRTVYFILGMILVAGLGVLSRTALAAPTEAQRSMASPGHVTVLDPYACRTVTAAVSSPWWNHGQVLRRRMRPRPWPDRIRIPVRPPRRSPFRPCTVR